MQKPAITPGSLIILMMLFLYAQAASPQAEECLSCHTSAKSLEKLMPKEEAVKKEGAGEG